jgi:hypothetical protein
MIPPRLCPATLKKGCLLFLLGFMVWGFLTVKFSWAESVKLKNGNTLRGKIIKEDDEAIWLETAYSTGKGVAKIKKTEIEEYVSIKKTEQNFELKPAFVAPIDPKRKSFGFPDGAFSLEIPEGYKVDPEATHEDPKTLARTAAFLKEYKGLEYTTRVVIDFRPLSQSVALDKYFSGFINELKKKDAGLFYKVASQGDTRIFNLPAKWVIYLGHSKSIYTVVLKGQRAYVLECSTTAKSFDQHKAEFDQIVKSAKFE